VQDIMELADLKRRIQRLERLTKGLAKEIVL
jgi:hypothetical protein